MNVFTFFILTQKYVFNLKVVICVKCKMHLIFGGCNSRPVSVVILKKQQAQIYFLRFVPQKGVLIAVFIATKGQIKLSL